MRSIYYGQGHLAIPVVHQERFWSGRSRRIRKTADPQDDSQKEMRCRLL